MADQISVSKNEIKQYYEAEVSLVLRHERRHSSCMDPFEASLLSPPNNESDTSGSTGRVIDAKDLIDEQRWQEFAKWQLERYKAVESANVAQRWADMNGLNLDGSRKTAQNHVQAKIHAQFPQNIPAQQDPQTAELSDKGAPAKESAPSKKRNRGIGKEMPVMLAGQADLFAAPPSTSSRKAPAALPGTIKRSAKTRASTSKLFQPLESSSDEDEHAATEFKTAHTAGPPLKRNRRNSAEKSDFVVKPTDTSSRLSVKSTASSVSKPKLIKAMSLPEGRQMVCFLEHSAWDIILLMPSIVVLKVPKHFTIRNIPQRKQSCSLRQLQKIGK